MKKLIILILLFINSTVYASYFKTFTNISPNKIWTLKFNTQIKFSKDSIVVKEDNGKIINCTFKKGSDGKSIIIYPPDGGYELNKKYIIETKKNIKSLAGRPIKQEYRIFFTTIPKHKAIVDIKIGQTPWYKEIKIKQTSINGAVKFKFENSSIYFNLNETVKIIMPEDNPKIYFYNSKNQLLYTGYINLKEEAENKEIEI
ncbi:hypothetical protein SAMN05660865_00024 [Caloramator fervidus]|uniref:SbsA Ig-like domain-containing protein n=1 Tax=Caloramator fervidus TaxID=29344 RepID=A0A1H5RM64_9CLOT|nr:Ig-like domain-containing protein [Caloramator fervidus]SEF38581.1 hypothetical protein SAMN05660865_00024 [Caloramator fervidus]